MNGRTRTVVAPVVLGLALLLGWWLVTTLSGLPDFVLPPPTEVAARMVTELGRTQFWHAIGLTMFEALGGSLLGGLVAVPLAIAIHESRWFSAAVNPFLGATQAIPAIALAPLLVLWVGYGLFPVMVLCALMVFFPILIGTVLGLRHVDPELVDAARMDGAGPLALLRFIEGPLSLPSTLAGLRNGVTLSITGAVVGEMVMGGQGLGELLTVQRDQMDTAGMFCSIATLCLVASLVYTLIHTVERRSRVVNAQLRES